MTQKQTVFRTLNVIDLISLFIEKIPSSLLTDIATDGKIRREGDWNALSKARDHYRKRRDN